MLSDEGGADRKSATTVLPRETPLDFPTERGSRPLAVNAGAGPQRSMREPALSGQCGSRPLAVNASAGLYRSHPVGSSGDEPLRTSKWSTGPFSEPSSPERPMTAPAWTSVPVATFTSERWL